MGSRFEDSTSSLQYKRHDASSMTSVVSPPCSDARTKKRRLSLVPEERRSHEPSFREKALVLVGHDVPLAKHDQTVRATPRSPREDSQHHGSSSGACR